ncbi:MAG: AzlC family ABC transporter permease [Acidimicrobiales bacterium]|nr:AzlC family ABC transporter permease [Acidimicrobiales bacterium]
MSVVDDLRDGMLASPCSPAARTAVKDIMPFTVAIIPFGFAVGTAGAAAGLSLAELMFGAVALLAGAGQLAAIQSIDRGDGIFVVASVVALVNLRFVIYGAGIANWFGRLPLRRRLALAFPVVDQTFLLCQQRFGDDVSLGWRQRYFLTATAVLGGMFVATQALAYQIGASVPDGLGLHLAAPLTFTALFARATSGRKELTAGAVAGCLVVALSAPLGPAALPVAVVLGACAGLGGWSRP